MKTTRDILLLAVAAVCVIARVRELKERNEDKDVEDIVDDGFRVATAFASKAEASGIDLSEPLG